VNANAVQTVASPTPILDRVTPLPKMESTLRGSAKFLVVWFGFVFVATFTAVFWHPPLVRRMASILAQASLPTHWNTTTVAVFPWLFLAAFFLAIAVHELGHALVGIAAGFRFNSLRIARFQFDRPFRISLYRGRGTGSGGWASLFPVKQDKLILRTSVMLLAGPGANLASAAALLALPYATGRFAAMFVFWSLMLGVVNLVPFRNRAVISDGGRILMLLQNRARGERWVAMLKLLEELRSGVPYENLTPGFLAKATAIEDNSPDTVVAFALAYGAAFWQHKDAEAARLLETCLRHANLTSPTQRQGLMTDAACFQARRRKRIDLAEQWLADIPEKGEYPWMRRRGEAAILEANGDILGALKKIDEIETMILAVPNQALREISLRGLHRWKAELQQPVPATQAKRAPASSLL
jgi:hypothetical protein